MAVNIVKPIHDQPRIVPGAARDNVALGVSKILVLRIASRVPRFTLKRMTEARHALSTAKLACACAALLLSASPSPHAAAAERTPPAYFRAGADVVLINATVLDRDSRPVRGLARADFRLFEDGKQQTVSSFTEEEVPLSLAIVFDTSGSMQGKSGRAREALGAMLRDSNAADEFSLITFADRPQLAVPWTGDAGDVQNDVLFAKPHGSTSLLDAIALGLGRMGSARNPRRAILILSDGGDNHSRNTWRGIARRLEEAGVEMYALDMSADAILRNFSSEEFAGPELLERLCDAAGGRYFQVDGAKQLTAAAEQISRELRSQYVLGYSPLDKAGDGRFRRVRVQVVPPAGASRLSVYWRRGYRVPARNAF